MRVTMTKLKFVQWFFTECVTMAAIATSNGGPGVLSALGVMLIKLKCYSPLTFWRSFANEVDTYLHAFIHDPDRDSFFVCKRVLTSIDTYYMIRDLFPEIHNRTFIVGRFTRPGDSHLEMPSSFIPHV